MKIDVELDPKLKEFFNQDDIKSATKKVLKRAVSQTQEKAMRKVKVVTGHLKRSIGYEIDALDGSDMTGTIGATAEYAGYVEKGTRFMSPRPYLEPSLHEVEPKFREDMDRIAKLGGAAQ